MTILLCNAKGGTGKTTLCVLLAHALAEAYTRPSSDRDPQGTATKWLPGSDSQKVRLYEPMSAVHDAVFH